MILYLDTSALVKKYVKEPGSSKVVSAWKKALGIATSAVTYAVACGVRHAIFGIFY
jgi:predicted nucleic acid-binding protein